LLSSRKLSTLILCTLIFSTLSFAAAPDRIVGPVSSASMATLARGTYAHPWAQYDKGSVEATFPLNHVTLLITPSPSQQRTLDRLLAQQQDPHSPYYHQWLTPEQYAQRFGLSPNDIQKISGWLQSEGFTVLEIARGGNAIAFSGTAAQIEKAFQAQIHSYDVDGQARFGNATAPHIPTALSGIVTGMRGLSNFHLTPRARRMNPDYYDAHFNVDFMAPGDAGTIYDINPLYAAGNDGTGQKLAIIGQTDIYLADIADFRTGFSLSPITGCSVDANNLITACNTANFKYVFTGGTDPHAPSTGDLGEADIDIEWSGAIAQNAQVIFVNSPDPSGNGVLDSMAYAINHDVAPVVSMSYGLCEFFTAENAAGGFPVFTEAEFKQANSQGMTIVNSSGDSGAATCDAPFTPGLATNGYAVSYPASSLYVTAVGGSSVSYQNVVTGQYWGTPNGNTGGSALSYIPELAWNDDEQFAAFCVANPTNSFCTGNGITSQFTAQNALGILSDGGGMSNCFTIDVNRVCTGGLAQPSWQTVTVAGLISSQTIPNPAPRFVPDVSLLASNFPGFITCTAQFEVGGGSSASTCANGIAGAIDTWGSIFIGTSIASPMFAGVVTLLNQYVGNANGMGNANPMLYKVAAIAPSAFHDITTGDNTVYCVKGDPVGQPASILCPAPVAPDPNSKLGYAAATGYDLATGLGSVDVNNLAIFSRNEQP
jgi:subtilase family serine protease